MIRMELTFAIVISIISVVITVINFALGRKDKAIKDTKEDNYGLLNYKIDELREGMNRLVDRFDRYEREIDNKLEKAVNNHIKVYHSKGGNA